MPKIPIYGEPQMALPTARGKELSGGEIQQIGWWGGGQMARQGQEMLGHAKELMGMEIERQRDEASILFEKNRAAFEVEWAKREDTHKNEDSANVQKYSDTGYGGAESKDPKTYYNRSVQTFQELANSEKYQSKNQFLNQAWQKWIAAKEADVKIAAIRFEASQRIQARENNIDEAIKNDAVLAAAEPARVPELVAKWRAILGNKGDAKDANGQPLPNYTNAVRGQFLLDRLNRVGAVIGGPALEKMLEDDPKAAWAILTAMQKDAQALSAAGKPLGPEPLPNQGVATIRGRTLESVNTELAQELELNQSWVNKPAKEKKALVAEQKKRIDGLEKLRGELIVEQTRLDGKYEADKKDFEKRRAAQAEPKRRSEEHTSELQSH